MKKKEVFTTTEVANICHISKQKVVNLFDQGEIEGFRIPGPRGSKSWARRIPLKSLLDFMTRHNIPTDALDAGAAAQRKKLLIVEDDRHSAELLEAVLDSIKDQVEIKVARNGSEAAFLLGGFEPDLVVLDIMLPDIDGDEILSRLEKSEALKSITVVVVTALDDENRKKALLERGATHYFTKPLDTALFKQKILKLLDLDVPKR